MTTQLSRDAGVSIFQFLMILRTHLNPSLQCVAALLLSLSHRLRGYRYGYKYLTINGIDNEEREGHLVFSGKSVHSPGIIEKAASNNFWDKHIYQVEALQYFMLYFWKLIRMHILRITIFYHLVQKHLWGLNFPPLTLFLTHLVYESSYLQDKFVLALWELNSREQCGQQANKFLCSAPEQSSPTYTPFKNFLKYTYTQDNEKKQTVTCNSKVQLSTFKKMSCISSIISAITQLNYIYISEFPQLQTVLFLK